MHQLDVSQLSTYLQITKRAVQRRAKDGKWPCVKALGLGGNRLLFKFETLPFDVKGKIIAFITANHAALNLDIKVPKNKNSCFANGTKDSLYIDTRCHGTHWYSQHSFVNELDQTELNKPYICQGMLVLARLYMQKHQVAKIAGYDQFSQLFTKRQLALNPKVYTVVSKVSRITLIRWEKLYEGNAPKSQDDLKNKSLWLFDPKVISLIKEYVNLMPSITTLQLKAYLTLISNERCKITNAEISELLEHLK